MHENLKIFIEQNIIVKITEFVFSALHSAHVCNMTNDWKTIIKRQHSFVYGTGKNLLMAIIRQYVTSLCLGDIARTMVRPPGSRLSTSLFGSRRKLRFLGIFRGRPAFVRLSSVLKKNM